MGPMIRKNHRLSTQTGFALRSPRQDFHRYRTPAHPERGRSVCYSGLRAQTPIMGPNALIWSSPPSAYNLLDQSYDAAAGTPDERCRSLFRATPQHGNQQTAPSLESQPEGSRAFLRPSRQHPRRYEHLAARARDPLSGPSGVVFYASLISSMLFPSGSKRSTD